MNLKQEHQQGIRAFENCLQTCINLGHTIKEMHFEGLGLTTEVIERIKSGKQYMTEAQFHQFTTILRSPRMIDKPFIHWLMFADHWALVGILEPLFSLKKHITGEIIANIRAILDFPNVIINNPELQINEGDYLSHVCPHGGTEELFISEVDYSPYEFGHAPVYTLTVKRSKPYMQNTNTINISGNVQMDGNARLNTGNITDNSSNTFYELSPNLFDDMRKLLESVNESYKQEFREAIDKLEIAKNKNDKKELGKWFGRLFSLSFIADCFTVFQPVIGALVKYFGF